MHKLQKCAPTTKSRMNTAHRQRVAANVTTIKTRVIAIIIHADYGLPIVQSTGRCSGDRNGAKHTNQQGYGPMIRFEVLRFIS